MGNHILYLKNKILLIFILTISSSNGSVTQDLLNINENLKNNRTPFIIKRKCDSAIGKHEFDQYKVISGKSGWTKTNNSTNLKGNPNIQSENKKSFVLIDKNHDSVINNMVISSKAEIMVDSIIDISIGNIIMTQANNNFFNRTFFDWNGRTLNEGSETFIANFSFSKNTHSWNLLAIYPIWVQVDENYQMNNTTSFKAALTNGSSNIEIRKITQIEGTKISFLSRPVEGYEFYLDNKSIAAIQYNPINKLYLWLRRDLDEDLKLIIAAASTSLLIKQF